MLIAFAFTKGTRAISELYCVLLRNRIAGATGCKIFASHEHCTPPYNKRSKSSAYEHNKRTSQVGAPDALAFDALEDADDEEESRERLL